MVQAIRSKRITGWHDPIVVPVGPHPVALPTFGTEIGNIRTLHEVAKHGTMDEYVKMREGR
jgi:hypothetical protein